MPLSYYITVFIECQKPPPERYAKLIYISTVETIKLVFNTLDLGRVIGKVIELQIRIKCTSCTMHHQYSLRKCNSLVARQLNVFGTCS